MKNNTDKPKYVEVAENNLSDAEIIKKLQKEVEDYKTAYSVRDDEDDFILTVKEMEIFLELNEYIFDKRSNLIKNREGDVMYRVYTYKEDLELCRKLWGKK